MKRTICALTSILLAGTVLGAVIENDILRVEMSGPHGAFSVSDKRTGRTWRQVPEEHAVAVTNVRQAANMILFEAEAKGVKGALFGELTLVGASVRARIDGAADLPFEVGDDNLVGWPCPFATEKGDRTLLPHGSGFSFPAEQTDMGEKFYRRMHGYSRSMRMGMWGQYREKIAADGEVLGAGGCLAVVETPCNSVGFYLQRDNGLMAFSLLWENDMRTWGHARVVRYEFLTDGSPMDMAVRYREEMKRKGYYKLFSQKAEERPGMADSFRKISGSPSVWYWAADGGKADVCRYLRETCGFGDFLFQFAARKDLGVWVTPEEVKACAEAAPGVLLSEYDIYMDTMDSKYIPLIEYVRPYWSTDAADAGDIIRQYDGSIRRGWKVAFRGQADGIGDGIGCATICEKKVAYYVRKRLRAELAKYPWYTARYFDCEGCCLPLECWDRRHRMNRRECVELRREMLSIPGDEFNLIASTEDGPDYLASVCDYFTCGFSADNDYRVDGGRWMWKIYDGEPPDAIRRGTDEKTRMPIFEMVYHGCSVAYWDWCDYNFKFPQIWWKRDLFNALCGTPPLYFFDEQTWKRFRDQLGPSYRTTTTIAKATYSTPMRAYRILTPDRTVHRVEFENGVASTVNFGDRPFAMSDGYILAPHGHRFEIP